MSLSQYEADNLLDMDKYTTSTSTIKMPAPGGKLKLDFNSLNGSETFVIDFSTNEYKLIKRSHHLREINNIGLARLCLHGKPHKNNKKLGGRKIGPCHLHIYRPGFELKYAEDVPSGLFRNLNSFELTLQDFMKYCNVVKPPNLI